MQRVLVGTGASAEVTFYLNGTPTDTDSPPTYRVLNGESEEVAAGTGTPTGSPGVYTASLGAAGDQLDNLTVEWSATVGGNAATLTQLVEVVGGHIFSIADARRVRPFSSEEAWPEPLLRDMRVLVEQALEDACGRAFVPRYARERIDGWGRELVLGFPDVRRLRKLTVDGTPLTADELAEVIVTPEGTLYRPSGFPEGRANIEAVYEHGMSAAPGRVPLAAIKVLRQLAVDSPVSDRAVSLTNEDGTYSSFVVAGVRGAAFSVPEANAVVSHYREPVIA